MANLLFFWWGLEAQFSFFGWGLKPQVPFLVGAQGPRVLILSKVSKNMHVCSYG